MTLTTPATDTQNGTAAEQLPLAAGRWVVDAAHANVGFSVRRLAIAAVHGVFHRLRGRFRSARPLDESRLSVTIDASTVVTGNDLHDGHLRSADFRFEAHPQIRFHSEAIRPASEGRYTVHGQLELLGNRRPFSFTAQLDGVATDPRGTIEKRVSSPVASSTAANGA